MLLASITWILWGMSFNNEKYFNINGVVLFKAITSSLEAP